MPGPGGSSFREYYNTILPQRSLNTLFAGEEACEPAHNFGGVRNCFLFHYIIDGSGKVRIENRIVDISAGGGFILYPSRRHLYRASASDPWHYVWVGFSGKHAEETLASCGFSADNSTFSRPYSSELASLFFRIIETLRMKGEGYGLKADGLLHLILSALAESAAAGPHGSRSAPPDYAAEVRRFIETNYQRRISVRDIALSVGLERSYLSALFTRKNGKSIKRHLTEYRIAKAKELLASTPYAVREIAASVGYGDYVTFAKRFHLETGFSPTAFRENVRRTSFE